MTRHPELKVGFTTGTALTASVKAALTLLLTGRTLDEVRVSLPGRRTWTVPLRQVEALAERRARASVVKDAGDDPDLTHRAEVGAVVELLEPEEGLVFAAGPGVGTVTRPGLPLAVGQPAINPSVRRQVLRAVQEVLRAADRPEAGFGLRVEAFITGGQELAQKTLNPKLGIVGGLSILGTTGLVKPFSHAAFRATIVVELKVARAAGRERIILATGRSSARLARRRLGEAEESCVQVGDHVAFGLRQAGRLGFGRAVVAAFFGKTLKLARGLGQTRFDAAPMKLEPLAQLTLDLTGDESLARAVAGANTARQALELLDRAGAGAVIRAAAEQARDYCGRTAGPDMEVGYLLFDPEGRILYEAGT